MKGELIGQNVEIIESKNVTLQGRKGTILDETKETITIGNGESIKVLKRGSHFKIGDKLINGDEIARRPEERLKL
jgi:ribonuclease P protein subunit POP4